MAKKNRQIIFMFNEGSKENETNFIRGGKGAGLNWLTKRGYPVPPGFTITTSAGRAIEENGNFPRRFEWQLNRAIGLLEKQTGKKLGDPKNPLILSVRSGAEKSMPGMMDSILNIGLNDEIVYSQEDGDTKHFYMCCYLRLLLNYVATVCQINTRYLEVEIDLAKTRLGLNSISLFPEKQLEKLCKSITFWTNMEEKINFPQNPREQIIASIKAIYQSWNSKRAIEYRRANDIPKWKNTAVNIQAMVFGNRDEKSATGVALSHDLITGGVEFNGEILIKAQGDDLVSGETTPSDIVELKNFNPGAYNELKQSILAIAQDLGEPVDVEWTMESGKLYILQVRPAKRTAIAAATILVRKVWNSRAKKEDIVKMLSKREIQSLSIQEFDESDVKNKNLITEGIGASLGALNGVVVFNKNELEREKSKGNKVILLRRTTTPEDFSLMLNSDGIVTATGGKTCHAAIVAKGLNKPAIVGVENLVIYDSGAKIGNYWISSGNTISIDGFSGKIFHGIIPLKNGEKTKEVNIFLKWVYQHNSQFPLPRVGFEYFNKPGILLNEALNNFYLLNSMAQEASGNLKDRIINFYRSYSIELAERIACYLILAVGGELRNLDDDYKYFEPLKSELSWLRNNGISTSKIERPEAHKLIYAKLKKCEIETHISFCEKSIKVMEAPIWGCSYGGKKWAVIAETLLMFLKGEINHELFTDRAFDLKHNGGMAFNKNAMFLAHSYQLEQQLDIKQSSKSVELLHKRLKDAYNSFSPEVTAFFKEGVNKGYWGM